MIGLITGWQKDQPRTIIIDLLTIRVVRQAFIWTLEELEWAIKSASIIIVSTSMDEQT